MSPRSAEEPFWRYVHDLYDRMAADAPEDHVTRVNVHLHSGESFAPGLAQSMPPWMIFQSFDEDQEPRVVIVRPEEIAKIELRFVPNHEIQRSIGFQFRPEPEVPAHG
jgi:hypothetical protein